MIYTELTKKAMIIAYNAHMNQFDKAGIPYIYHPIHLAEQMETEVECIVALLHDVVEDTKITFEQLEKEFPIDVITALRLLTHDKDIDYMEYIEEIKKDSIAKKVKIADIIHNMDVTRLNNVIEISIKKRKKYMKALDILKDKGDSYE